VSRRVLLSFAPHNLGKFNARTMDLRQLGSAAGADGGPKEGSDRSALVIYPPTLSGVFDAIGLNRTLQLTTDGSA
jgi:hypothetical protein